MWDVTKACTMVAADSVSNDLPQPIKSGRVDVGNVLVHWPTAEKM